MTPIRFLALALTVLAVASCAEKSPMPAPAGPVWEEPQISRLLKVYHQELPGRPRVLELYLTSSDDTLRVLLPPDGVVEYSYFHYNRVEWSDPFESRLRSGESLKESPFYLDQVALNRLPELVRTAKEKMSFEGAKIAGIHVRRGPPPARDLQIEIVFDGQSHSGRVFADRNGNVQKVEIQ